MIKRWTDQIRAEGEREKAGGRNRAPAGGAAIAGGDEVVGERETHPSCHGSMNRAHRGRGKVKATSPRPRTWSEDMADAVVAMAGDVKLPGARG